MRRTYLPYTYLLANQVRNLGDLDCNTSMGASFRRPKTTLDLIDQNGKRRRISYVPRLPDAPVTSLYMYVASKVGIVVGGNVRLAPNAFYLLDTNTRQYLLPESIQRSQTRAVPAVVTVELGDDARTVDRLEHSTSAAELSRVALLKQNLQAKWDKYRKAHDVSGFPLPGSSSRPETSRGREVQYRPGVRV